jgi:hypothetical protein
VTDERTLDRAIAQLRAQVAELRRLEHTGGRPDEVAERRQLITRLQQHLADAVVEVLHPPRRPRTR